MVFHAGIACRGPMSLSGYRVGANNDLLGDHHGCEFWYVRSVQLRALGQHRYGIRHVLGEYELHHRPECRAGKLFRQNHVQWFASPHLQSLHRYAPNNRVGRWKRIDHDSRGKRHKCFLYRLRKSAGAAKRLRRRVRRFHYRHDQLLKAAIKRNIVRHLLISHTI